jgi:hypothetical protein
MLRAISFFFIVNRVLHPIFFKKERLDCLGLIVKEEEIKFVFAFVS